MATGQRGGGGASGDPLPRPGEVYLEYLPLGHQLRVIAVDAATGIEVTVVGPTSVPPEEVGRIAARKLKRRLAAREEAARRR